MKTFEVRTPIINESIAAFRYVRDGVENKSLDNEAARRLNTAGHGMLRAVKTDLEARLAGPKLKRIESIIIEQSPLEIDATPEIPNVPDIVE